MRLLQIVCSSVPCVSRAPSTLQQLAGQAMIGLEVHTQLQSRSKLFSGAGYKYGHAVNTDTCPFDLSMPGTLPLLNVDCVWSAVRCVHALSAQLHSLSQFDRKHYFYADMPNGYQITQQRHPIGSKGVALIELVTAPDMSSAIEAVCFAKELQHLLFACQISNARMEEGSMRVDANVSIRDGLGQPGVRTEIKNLNSFRALLNAIEYEIKRQKELIEAGEEVINETLGYSDQDKCTYQMRDKEQKLDYRFMPEPNLPPLRIYDSQKETVPKGQVDVSAVRAVPLPRTQYDVISWLYSVQLSARLVHYITDDRDRQRLFVLVLSELHTDAVPMAATFLRQRFLLQLQQANLSITDCAVQPNRLIDLVNLIYNEKVTEETAIYIMSKLMHNPQDDRFPADIACQDDLLRTDDVPFIIDVCEQVLREEHESMEEYKLGMRRKSLRKLFVRRAQEHCKYRATMTDIKQQMEPLLQVYIDKMQ